MGSEIIFVVPYMAAFAAVVTIFGTSITWLVWRLARRLGFRLKRENSGAFPIRHVALVLLCLALPVGCVWALRPVPQPENLRTVAAFEVPLSSAQDRADFLAILNRETAAEGLDVSAESERELERRNEMFPDLRQTISISIWRGDIRRGNEADVTDRSHIGRAWISFKQGNDPTLAQRFRDKTMRSVFERWPETLSIPVGATGALPLKEDLVLGDGGYEFDPGKLADYSCDPALGPNAAPPEACR